MSDFSEAPVLFGSDDHLFGLLTRPQGLTGQMSDIGCLVLNTGVNHRIGPHRINVKAARRLAGAGLPALRFDLSGIGDSVAAQSRNGYRAQALEDMKAAMDFLSQRHGLRRFLVFGICSGAENGLALALDDPRVIGLLSFDGEIYMTRTVRLERKLRRMAAFPRNAAVRASYPWWHDLVGWLGDGDAAARERSLGRLRALLPHRAAAAEAGGFLGGGEGKVFSAADYERALLSLVDRGVALSLMYSNTYNGFDRDHSMLSQLRGSRLFGLVQYRFWPDIDHTATTLAMQARLLDAVDSWARGVAFGPAAQSQAASGAITTSGPAEMAAASDCASGKSRAK
ncbi:hypothetical protein [Variovorax sp. UMC13]|uniref:hypothetical protein n=1 Tax=Variovorax sp. UMC13 TaxID=1862326 RepID=UPI001601721D|nr:hypothetical protein [Variovorax sp. UMC13]MBB1603156.1 hypothetical protein [Variovorax sp. UMC13]